MVDLCLALLVYLLAEGFLTARLPEHPLNIVPETNKAITSRKSEDLFIIPLLFRENTLLI
jgi:hypothetical protein